MSISAKLILPLIKRVIPYLPLLPTPLLSLPPTLLLHLTSHPSPSATSFISSSTTHPLHLPITFTLIAIPVIYILGLISGNVSWVDRAWPFYTPFCTTLLVAWLWLNQDGVVYGHNLPRVGLMWALQLLWSTRLLSHALKRDFYNLRSEDYRYTAFRSLVPRPLFALVHLFVVAIAQPLLLLALSLPVHAVLTLPPSELASTGGYDLKWKTVKGFLPSRFDAAGFGSAGDDTPVLNLSDLAVFVLAVACLYVEWRTDREMYKYQSSKHSILDQAKANNNSTSTATVPPSDSSGSTLPKIYRPSKLSDKKAQDGNPQPSPYPLSHHPGFPTRGRWRWSRHPNFAAEQLFWVTQALIVVGGARSSGVTRRGWGAGAGSVFGPCFALSILFCASTFLTEWITSRKFPAYKPYRRLVGQFVPQETAWIWLWGTITRGRARDVKAVYEVSQLDDDAGTIDGL
ncbi:hypothetical protein I317_07107 [Kwoniella heveanensis CBS 569]|nr:hypothetical protein I317_07107 [Kwoniella heveanensis CBS 569]